MKYRPTRALTVIGAALVLMAAGAVAYAQIPSADGTISACYTKSTGTIRIVNTGVACKKGETSLAWNQHGNPGTNGTKCTNGTSGVSGYEHVASTDTVTANQQGFFGGLTASCPVGKKVTGGGATVDSDGSVTTGDYVLQSGPRDDSSYGAVFSVANALRRDVTIRVVAICAGVTP